MPHRKRAPQPSSPPQSPPDHHYHHHRHMENTEIQEPPPPQPPRSSSLRKSKQPKTKNKTKPLSKKQQAIVEQKLSILSKTLRPLPFAPSPQTLASISSHEPLLRSLRLWDFARLPLPSSSSLLRPDLLSHLIAHYDPLNRRSLVLGHRISLSRADLARALFLPLPVKKSDDSAFDPSQFGGADAVAAALSEFISGAMVLLEDAAILPDEVVTAHRIVREGQPHKVDWAGLMWALVDREMAGLVEEGCDGACYYASHLQCLLKFQKPKLFEEDAAAEVEVEPSEAATMEEDGVEVGDAAEEGEKGEEDMEVDYASDLHVESFKGDEGGENLSNREENKDLVTENFPPLENLNSSDFLQAMEGNNDLSFGVEQSVGDLLGMPSKGVSLDAGPACSFSLGNDHKRVLDEINAHVGDGFIEQQKRFRSEQPWEQTPAVQSFNGCREEVQQLMEKARMDLLGKEQAYMDARAQIDYLNGVLQQKDARIGSLHKARMEELRKRQYEECRLEHDVRTLGSVLLGYRRALRDTQIAFAEYRKKFPFSDESIAEDGGRVAGDVEGATELRKPCDPKEAEMRQFFKTMVQDESKKWFQKLNEYATRVAESAKKVVRLHEEFKLLKEKAGKANDQIHG